jgi:hypothetical protein
MILRRDKNSEMKFYRRVNNESGRYIPALTKALTNVDARLARAESTLAVDDPTTAIVRTNGGGELER